MQDYNKATIILELLLDEVVFENIALKQFISLVGYLIKFSNFSEKIISKYLIYIKEINDYINRVLIRKEKEKEPIMKDEEYLYGIKAYMFYFGFKDIEKHIFKNKMNFLNIISKRNYIILN
jgi:hypothetical protein